MSQELNCKRGAIMKRSVFITFILFFVLSFAWMAWALPTLVKDTKHNLSTSGTGSYKSDSASAGGTSEICVFCHTPHGGNTDAPLWNRTNVGFVTPYRSDVMSALSTTFEGATDLGSGTKHAKTRICLSCHDGTIAMGNVVNLPQGLTGDIPILNTLSGKMPLAAAGYIGTNLSDDHPVAVKYYSSSPDLELKNLISPLSPNGGPIYLYDSSAARQTAPGADTYIECTSCHNAHNNGLGNFLRVPIQESYLCLQCHIK